jgi:quercetin dioxygenase-like cupin family protein
MIEPTTKNPSRRSFMRTAPVAAALLAAADPSTFASFADAQSAQPAGSAGTFQVFTADAIQTDIKLLEVNAANSNLVAAKNFTVSLGTETAKSAKEFEWHEGRDHVMQILDGSTVYELGGTPKNARNIRPGEWLAPDSEGAASVTLHKGDLLVIPRGTPHRRSTAGTVTILLIAPLTNAAS